MKYKGILLVLVSALIIGCGSTMEPLREQGELQGKVFVIGNDPFTRLALARDDRNSVVLICLPDVEKYLRSHQGETIKVTYEGISRVPEGQAVRVTSAARVNE